MKSNIYLELTDEFNAGRVRVVICSGQAAVLHRVAIMSKDGDWILRENEEACRHVLTVLERHGARYRFGAPSGQWRKRWPEIMSQITALPLLEAHAMLVKEAEKFLPVQHL